MKIMDEIKNTENPTKRVAVKSAMKRLFSLPFSKKTVLTDEHEMFKSKIHDDFDVIKKSMTSDFDSRDPWRPGAPNMADFNQVLQHWGIKPDQLRGVIRNLTLETAIYTLGGIWGLYYFLTASAWNFIGLPFVSLALVVLVCRGWRIQVLMRRRFTFFKDWFLWGAFAWIGRPTPFAVQSKIKTREIEKK